MKIFNPLTGKDEEIKHDDGTIHCESCKNRRAVGICHTFRMQNISPKESFFVSCNCGHVKTFNNHSEYVKYIKCAL